MYDILIIGAGLIGAAAARLGAAPWPADLAETPFCV